MIRIFVKGADYYARPEYLVVIDIDGKPKTDNQYVIRAIRNKFYNIFLYTEARVLEGILELDKETGVRSIDGIELGNGPTKVGVITQTLDFLSDEENVYDFLCPIRELINTQLLLLLGELQN